MGVKDEELKLWVDTSGWQATDLDDFINDVLSLASEKYGASSAHVEMPMKLWQSKEEPPAVAGEDRCTSVNTKPMHSYTRTNAARTIQGSSWRCVLKAGHPGLHRADDKAHQAPWGDR